MATATQATEAKEETLTSRTVAASEPTCKAAWESRIGALPHDIGERYNTSLLTPKDWMSHYKNVLHRAMWVKGHDPIDKACRVCRLAQESIEHYAECEKMRPIFEAFAHLASVDMSKATTTEWKRLALFALPPRGKMAEGWINMRCTFCCGSNVYTSSQ